MIQNYPEELDYVNARIKQSEEGGFLETFCKACLRADQDNYEIIRYALRLLMDKYPLSRGTSNEASA